LTAFLWIELTAKKPLLNLRLLFRRNFGFGMSANFLLGVALYGSVFILPVYLSRIQGYNAEQIGMVLAWTGLPQLLLIPLVPRLMDRFDPRLLIGVGFALFAASNFMNIYMTADYATDQLIRPDVDRAIEQLTQYFVNHGVTDRTEAAHRALVAIGHIVQKQAFILAFSDTFYLLGATMLVALMAAMFLRSPTVLHRAARIRTSSPRKENN